MLIGCTKWLLEYVGLVEFSTVVLIRNSIKYFRSSHRNCSKKNCPIWNSLKFSQNSPENTFSRVHYLIKLQALSSNFMKKENLSQVFSGGFWEIFKSNFLQSTSRQLLLIFVVEMFLQLKLTNLFKKQFSKKNLRLVFRSTLDLKINAKLLRSKYYIWPKIKLHNTKISWFIVVNVYYLKW